MQPHISIGFAGGDVNLFGYVQNNPINKKDPSGLEWRNGSYHYSEEELKVMEEKAGATGESMLEFAEFIGNLFENPVLINVTTKIVVPIIKAIVPKPDQLPSKVTEFDKYLFNLKGREITCD